MDAFQTQEFVVGTAKSLGWEIEIEVDSQFVAEKDGCVVMATVSPNDEEGYLLTGFSSSELAALIGLLGKDTTIALLDSRAKALRYTWNTNNGHWVPQFTLKGDEESMIAECQMFFRELLWLHRAIADARAALLAVLDEDPPTILTAV